MGHDRSTCATHRHGCDWRARGAHHRLQAQGASSAHAALTTAAFRVLTVKRLVPSVTVVQASAPAVIRAEAPRLSCAVGYSTLRRHRNSHVESRARRAPRTRCGTFARAAHIHSDANPTFAARA